jgi:hypothetical protein
MYVDIEPALVGWIPTVLTARAVTELPADLAGAITAHSGVVRVVRVGGPAPVPSLDIATVEIECFAATRAAARTLAYQLRDALRYQLPGHVFIAGGSVSRVQTVSGPAWRPYDDISVRRVGALYQITTHAA